MGTCKLEIVCMQVSTIGGVGLDKLLGTDVHRNTCSTYCDIVLSLLSDVIFERGAKRSFNGKWIVEMCYIESTKSVEFP